MSEIPEQLRWIGFTDDLVEQLEAGQRYAVSHSDQVVRSIAKDISLAIPRLKALSKLIEALNGIPPALQAQDQSEGGVNEA